jgi:hypothetical protein
VVDPSVGWHHVIRRKERNEDEATEGRLHLGREEVEQVPLECVPIATEVQTLCSSLTLSAG